MFLERYNTISRSVAFPLSHFPTFPLFTPFTPFSASTRQLTDSDIDSSGDIIASYSYDAYGMMLGGNPTSAAPPATNLLYTGEQFDTSAQQYYLRARYYDPSTGRFNRMDDFAGDMQDPQSLHKYLYCHANPVNITDPTGKWIGAVGGGILNVLSVVSIMMIATSLLIPIVRMGLAFKSILDLSCISQMIRNSPLDMETQLLLRNQITLLAIQNIAALFNAFGQFVLTVLTEAVYLIITGLVIHAAFTAVGAAMKGISNTALRVAQATGSTGDDMMRVERIISKGEKIVDVVDEVKNLTFQTGNEHAVVKLASGERAIVSGGPRGIGMSSRMVKRIFGHSHVTDLPGFKPGPSSADFMALEKLGHTTSYILEGEKLYRFTRLAGG